MRVAIVVALTVFLATAAFAETTNFDSDTRGSLPAGWMCGVTGRGSARWAVVGADRTAPSAPNVLKQTGKGTFPWCVKERVSIADGFVEVKFKS